MVLTDQSYYIICHLLVILFILAVERELTLCTKSVSARLLTAENPYNVYIRRIITTDNSSLYFYLISFTRQQDIFNQKNTVFQGITQVIFRFFPQIRLQTNNYGRPLVFRISKAIRLILTREIVQEYLFFRMCDQKSETHVTNRLDSKL